MERAQCGIQLKKGCRIRSAAFVFRAAASISGIGKKKGRIIEGLPA